MPDDAPVRRPAEAPVVTIRVDPYDADARIMVIDGVDSSYVALSDPTRLEFEYTRWIAHLLDTSAPPGPLTVVHVGGGGATLPRYVAVTRPGSSQLVTSKPGMSSWTPPMIAPMTTLSLQAAIQ